MVKQVRLEERLNGLNTDRVMECITTVLEYNQNRNNQQNRLSFEIKMNKLIKTTSILFERSLTTRKGSYLLLYYYYFSTDYSFISYSYAIYWPLYVLQPAALNCGRYR